MNQEDIKNEILSRIRSGKPTNRPLPEIPLYSYPGNPLENFIGKLLSFDGRAIKFKSRHDAVAWLETQPEMNRDKEIIYSSAAGVDGNISEDELTDLHNAHKIDTCVTESSMGVGEMGSVWVTDRFCVVMFGLINVNILYYSFSTLYQMCNLRQSL